VHPRTEQRNAVGPAGVDHRAAGTDGAQPPLACAIVATDIQILRVAAAALRAAPPLGECRRAPRRPTSTPCLCN